MLQGTSSSVGKTILTAALCRIFKQDGFSVAPFKSQNMTSNSFITKDGKEIAGSQAIQAEAAGIEVTVEMNPILLKPTSDRKSQVIINGVLTSNMPASLYQEKKIELKKVIKNAYDVLSSKFDILVIEGAGSPAEINLSKNDIVNMGLANLVDAPVILIGDIDRGGIFASIYGTIMLLNEEERNRIKGFIINKFRGDLEILKPGIKMLEDLVNKPCLGVIPYFEINIEDEDSLVDPEEAGRRKDIKEKSSAEDYKKIKELEYDKLATTVRENIDIENIRSIMGINNGQ
ncbi:cobyric acid synthase [Alkaliphilus sp. B6464]|nr:cobyric acid synthase [Alkaliphilus sp. B6464]